MRTLRPSRLLLVTIAALVLVGCALVPGTTPSLSPIATSSVTPTPMPTTAVTPMPSATATATLSPSPSPTKEPSVPATIEPVLHELPYGLSEIPSGGGTYLREPESRSGNLDIGVPVEFRLDHCGLGSPVDIDGSLWDPKFGHDGHGEPIKGDERDELIQENRVTFTLVESDVAEMTFQEGLLVTLWRHDGSRRYHPCM